MPVVPLRLKSQPKEWPRAPIDLYNLSKLRVEEFCLANSLPIPNSTVIDASEWPFGACAFYRAEGCQRLARVNPAFANPGIFICLKHCGRPCTEYERRNWSWPGSDTDREPFGVMCHELGHHCDYHASERKGEYFGDYSHNLYDKVREKPISGYHDNIHEWFAEMARIFITNPGLLQQLRPRTYKLIRERFKPVATMNWIKALGDNVPEKIVKNLIKKGAKRVDTL